MRRLLIGLAVVAMCLGFAASAAAQSDSRDLARSHFERGMSLVQEERWEDALREFNESLRLYPTQTALFNRALCFGITGRPADGVRALDEYLQRYGATVTPDQRAEAESERARLRERIGSVNLQISGVTTAQVLLDGEPAGQAPLRGPLYVNPGRHNITINAENFDPISRWVNVEAGATVALVVAMVRSGPAAAPPPAPSPPVAPIAENTPSACRDGADNDGDGHLDCFDPDCADFVFCAPTAPPAQALLGQPAPPVQPVQPLVPTQPLPPLQVRTGWSLAAGILGVGFSGVVMGLGFASNTELGFGGNDGKAAGLGLSALLLATIAVPVVNAGSRSARRSDVRGCVGCRIPAWILYGLGLLDGMIALMYPVTEEDPPPWMIASATVMTSTALLLFSVDSFVAWAQARRMIRQQQAPAAAEAPLPETGPAPDAAPAPRAARRQIFAAPFVAPTRSPLGGQGALIGLSFSM